MVSNVERAPGMLRLGDSRDIQVTSFELEKEDVMRFKPIYEAIHQFMMEEGYRHPQSDNEYVEDLYWERWNAAGAKEQHIWWRWARTVNKYIRYFISINFQTINVTKAEVAYNNKKISGEKIDLTIRITCYLQWDYNDRFKNSIAEKFKHVFFSKIYDKDISDKKKLLELFAGRLSRLIRGYFEMVADAPTPVIFQPPMGYKEPV